MSHVHDSKALEFSREVMALMYGEMPPGGSVQLQAKIQCLFVNAMEFSAQQPVLVVPDGWVMAPAKASIAMIRAGGKAAREYLEEYGGNSPQVIYQAMLAAAPRQEAE